MVVDMGGLSSGNVVVGKTFMIALAVRNQSTGPSSATTLRHYLSTDTVITTGDTEVGATAVEGIPGESFTRRSISLTAPSNPGTYHYGACVDAVPEESNKDNNCSSSVTVTIYAGSDLVISDFNVSNSTQAATASFRISAKVTNQGQESSSSSVDVNFYVSTDAIISSSDTQVGTEFLGRLDASQESPPMLVYPNAPSTAGTYYYGACVDSVNLSGRPINESNTGNNCSSGTRITVIDAPDPRITLVDCIACRNAHNPLVPAGSPIRLTGSLENNGNLRSAPTTLRFYLSTDLTITTADTLVSTESVVAMDPRQIAFVSSNVNVPTTPGPYYYGACLAEVSGESDTSNNCSPPVLANVGAVPPDLVVDTPSVSETSPDAGGSFTLRATVRNQGDGPSASTTLRYYRSTDSTISSGDTSAGTDAVGGLSASGSSAEDISVTAPSTAGTYHYGACVDSVSGESDPTNNCSSGVAVAVGTPPAPDLVVGTPSVSDSSPDAGGSFTLRATVRNRGDGPSASTTLRYYRSTDSTISSGDTSAGTDAVGGLSASGSSAEDISVTAPSTAGTYHYGACVDSVTGESDTSDNCSTTVTVVVVSADTYGVGDFLPGVPTTGQFIPATISGANLSSSGGNTTITFSNGGYIELQNGTRFTCESSGGCRVHNGEVTRGTMTRAESSSETSADLAVDAPTVDTGAPTAGARFNLNATVRNQGNGRSDSTTLRYYQSSNPTITTSDTEVGTDYVSPLDPSESGDESVSLTAPSTAGTYYYRACVDAVSDESDTTNNCSVAVTVTVGAAPTPDLVVDAPTVDNSAPTAGARFTLSATVRNQGSGRSDSTALHYYRSTDSTITTSDTPVGTDSVSRLNASASGDEEIRLTAPSTPGTYYYGACVDAVSGETDTANNCSDAVAVTVVSAIPDLAIETPTVSDSSPHTGESFTLRVTVINQGNVRSDFTELRYYRSKDSTISSSDTQLARRNRPWLDPSESEAESIILKAPSSEGTYYFGACVDAVSGETDTANNCSAAVTVVVVTPISDLVVEVPTFSNSSPPAGTSFTLTATVRNQGIEPSSSSTTLRYYRSDDSTITTSDTPVDTDSVGTLDASGSSDESISLTAPTTPGTYYYGVCVDTISGESDASNNCSLAVTLNVVAAIPDLVAETPTVSESRPELGDSFTLSVTVRNQGNVRSARTTLRYYRSTDSTITTADTSVGTDSVSRLNVSAISTESTDLDTPSTLGTYYYGACVDTVSGESDTSNNCSDAVEVVVVVPSGPDLAVEMPTVSKDTLEPGESFTLSVTVRNTGSAGSGSTTLRYSTVLGTEVGTSALESLVASAIGTASITLTAPSTEGSIYYKVCVDPVPGETNTGNNCSGLVWITVPDSIEYELTECTITPGPDFDITIHVSLTAIRAVESVTIKGYVLNHGIGESVEIGRKTIRNMSAGETVNTTVTGSVSEHYFQCAIEVDWD